MAEAEWLSCTYPKRMLSFMWGKTSDRKIRLFAVTCCRRTWPWLVDPRSCAAVDGIGWTSGVARQCKS